MQEISSNKIVFDGKREAALIEESLKVQGLLRGKKLMIIQCDGLGRESTYVRLKREAGERIGAVVEVVFANGKEEILKTIINGDERADIDGILVQLPMKGVEEIDVEQILYTVPEAKDVDGLNPKSSFVPAVVLAVETVFEKLNIARDLSVALVGHEGMVGRRLYERLLQLGFVVSGFDRGDDLNLLRDFDVVIGATGAGELITENMVKDEFVGIDLGYPKADFSEGAIRKARAITPVPGGVGPLTIVSLFVNLAETGN